MTLAAAPAATPIVSLRGIGRIYDMGHVTVPALRDVDLEVNRGEFLAIVGPSGSGKSTMMNIIGCLDRPTTGTYALAGTPVEDLDDDALARVRSRTIGFVFQSYNLLPRTSAIDNVATPLAVPGRGEGRARPTGRRRPRSPRPGRPDGPRAERAVGWPAAARRRRPGDRHRPCPHPRRRADREPRPGLRGTTSSRSSASCTQPGARSSSSRTMPTWPGRPAARCTSGTGG